MFSNFKLIVITSERDNVGEAEWIDKLFRAGLVLLHYRKPTHTIAKARSFIESISPSFHSKIVIHNHYELLNEFDLKGIHMPEKIRKEGYSSVRENIVSTSFHILEDIIETKNSFEYAFFGPAFESISKQGYKPVVEINKVQVFFETNQAKIKFPIIALGGITDQNISEVRKMGFSGAACIGYIWENPNPVLQFEKLQKIING
jgi:thiamine-phosphate pyrophosphorylase